MPTKQDTIDETAMLDLHGQFIATVCQHLPAADLKHWMPEGAIDYRNICFLILPDRVADIALLSVAIDLGDILPAKRLAAYRHMATYNLSKGGPDHGVLGFNPLLPGSAMHRVAFPKTKDLLPAVFARSLRALASHALDFRAAYVKKSVSANNGHARFLALARHSLKES